MREHRGRRNFGQAASAIARRFYRPLRRSGKSLVATGDNILFLVSAFRFVVRAQWLLLQGAALGEVSAHPHCGDVTSKPCADLGENGPEHFLRQHAGIGIEPGAMITVGEQNRLCACAKAMPDRFARGQDVFGAMREGKRGQLLAEGPNDRLMGNPAEGNDRAKIRQSRDRCREKRAAAPNFLPHRLVLRRNAAHGVGDHASGEKQAIVGRCSVRARGKPEFDQCFIKKIAGKIAGKGPPRAVGAAQAGREANHQQTRVGRAEILNRSVVPFRLRCPKGIAIYYETRAKRTLRARRAGVAGTPLQSFVRSPESTSPETILRAILS